MPDPANSKSAGFGTFGGVFTPNVLTILGVILFMRAGWVVGSAGLVGAILIILVAKALTLATGFSLSAISTSGEVKGGGAYFLVSRSLGIEIGGSVGIPLCLAQAISVAFYIVGFTESLQSLHALRPLFELCSPKLVSTAVCVLLTLITLVGARLAIRVQYFILAALAFALVSFFLGWKPDVVRASAFAAAYPEGHNFWTVFAIYFPAATGIMAGVSMSGDLKNPHRSIPRGTLYAVLVTMAVYLLQAVWLWLNADRETLLENPMAMTGIARFAAPIYVGLWAATLSSALASLVAAPRTMQALARDRVLPRVLGRGSRVAGEPRMATLATFLVAQVCILLGDLNVIAPVITIFFLTTYGAINLAAGAERVVDNPSFRPAFRVHWLISAAGGLGCFVAMFLINPAATVVAVAVTSGIFIYVRRRQLRATWGDVRSGAWYSLVRFALLVFDRAKTHPKNWRPNIMVFSGNPHTRSHLINFADWLGQRRGIISLFHLIVAPEGGRKAIQATAQKQLERFIRQQQLQAFGEVHVVADFRRGVYDISRFHGLGRVKPNVVLMGWSGSPERARDYAGLVRDLAELRKNVLLLRMDPSRGFGDLRKIDIWWEDMQANGALMALVAYLLSQNAEWRRCRVRLLVHKRDERGSDSARTQLRGMLAEARIEAQVEVITPEPEADEHALAERSREADLVLLGFEPPPAGAEEEWVSRINAILEELPTAMLVHSADLHELSL